MCLSARRTRNSKAVSLMQMSDLFPSKPSLTLVLNSGTYSSLGKWLRGFWFSLSRVSSALEYPSVVLVIWSTRRLMQLNFHGTLSNESLILHQLHSQCTVWSDHNARWLILKFLARLESVKAFNNDFIFTSSLLWINDSTVFRFSNIRQHY